jgi:SAM-dependent methyltransferase
LICGGADFRFRFTKNNRHFWRCHSCGFETQWPLPNPAELIRFYDESYAAGLYREFAEARRLKLRTAELRLRRIAPFCRPGRWLDVGCSNGAFIETARRAGLEAEGIELSAAAVDEARRRGLSVAQQTIENYRPVCFFDAIAAFDVLEHVLDPIGFLEAAHRLLVPGGTLALSVPNLSSPVRKLMGRRWFFYIPEEHLHYFNPDTMKRLLSRTGFRMRLWARAFKPMTVPYALAQFKAYNPVIHAVGRVLASFIPRAYRDRDFPLPIGEMMIVADREAGFDPGRAE